MAIQTEEKDLSTKSEYQQRLSSLRHISKKLSSETIDTLVPKLASILHENWLAGYIAKNKEDEEGKIFPPRWKIVGDDSEWYRRLELDPNLKKIHRINEKGDHEVDIAHGRYDQLPKKAQDENKKAADTALEIIDQAVANNTKLDENFLENGAAEVHVAWKGRNEWVIQSESLQRLDYEDPNLPEFEKNKDREHIVLAAEIYSKATTL